MGRDYIWFNLDLQEFIDGVDFNTSYCTWPYYGAGKDNEYFQVIQHLLSSRWKACQVVQMETYCTNLKKQRKDIHAKLLEQYNAYYHEKSSAEHLELADFYKTPSILYKQCDQELKEEIGYDIEHPESEIYRNYVQEIDYADPWKGLFELEGRNFKYVLNHDKKCGYLLFETPAWDLNNKEIYGDPLPILAGLPAYDCKPGLWFGDHLEVSDEFKKGYKKIDGFILDI